MTYNVFGGTLNLIQPELLQKKFHVAVGHTRVLKPGVGRLTSLFMQCARMVPSLHIFPGILELRILNCLFCHFLHE